MHRMIRIAAAVCALAALGGCASVEHRVFARGEAPVLIGPPVRENTTPMEEAFACMRDWLVSAGAPVWGVGVGDVRDYTGKFSEADGGNPITQGGSLMVISALGKLGDRVRLHERFDTRVADMELAYVERRQLGDGREHLVQDGNAQQRVPWLPYHGGTVLRSDYFIVGGITELNYSLQSGGAEVGVAGIGPRARTFTVNVAADLRIVDTKSLVVKRTTSLQKQVVGYEVGIDVFRFFGTTLVDLNAGMKSQEPLQLAVRSTLEQGVLELIGAVTDVDAGPCLNGAARPARAEAAAAPAVVEEEAPIPAEARVFTVFFGLDSATLDPQARAVVDEAAAAAHEGNGPSSLLLEGHTDTAGDPVYNLALSQRRAEAVRDRLVERGIASERIALVWYGQTAPAVATADGVQEARNRRVVINVY